MKNKSYLFKKLLQFSLLRYVDLIATTFNNKINYLKEQFFLLLLEMDLLNIINIVYLPVLKKSAENITKNKILKVLKFMSSNKIPGFNKIINMILKLLLPDLLLIYF